MGAAVVGRWSGCGPDDARHGARHHHVEEIPAGFTHVLLLDRGRVAAAGPLDEVLSAEMVSAVFGLALALDRRDGRYAARAR